MKTIYSLTLNLVLLISLSITFSACNDEHPTPQNTQDTNLTSTTVDDHPDINQEVIDSLQNYNTKISEISVACDEAVANVKNMQSSVQQLNDIKIWIWVANAIALLALVLSIVALSKNSNLNKRLDRHREDISNLKLDKVKTSHQPQPISKPSVPTDYESLNRRVFDLEFSFNNLSATVGRLMINSSQKVEPTSTVNEVKVPEVENAFETKKGYFGIPVKSNDPYFKKLLKSQDSEARFSVEITGNKAYFKPIESSQYLGTFISSDALRVAIKFTGCEPENATQMKVITDGNAELKEDRWYITKKATVYLS